MDIGSISRREIALRENRQGIFSSSFGVEDGSEVGNKMYRFEGWFIDKGAEIKLDDGER